MKRKTIIFASILIVLLAMVAVRATSWTYATQPDWELGTHTNTTSNSSGVVILNQTTYDLYNDSSMIAWYHCDDDAGTTVVLDSTGVRNGALNVNTEDRTTAGKIAAGFDVHRDDNDYISVPDHASLPLDDFTIAFWVKHDAAGTMEDYISHGTSAGQLSLLLRKGISNQIYIYWSTNGAGWSGPLVSTELIGTEWTHIVVTRIGNTAAAYFNGTNPTLSSTAMAGTRHDATTDFLIGAEDTANVNEFTGLLDEIGVWNRGLVASEIQDLYWSTKGTYTTEVKDLGADQTFNAINVSIEGNSTPIDLKYQIRSCNDIACDTEHFQGGDNLSTNYYNLSEYDLTLSNISNNRYVQLKFFLDRGTATTSSLNNFTLNYTLYIAPTIAGSNVSYVTPNVVKYPVVRLGRTIEIEGNVDISGNLTYKTIYCESSDLNDQTFSVAGARYGLNISNNDEGYGIAMSTGDINGTNITIEVSGVYHLVAQPQVKAGAGGAGDFHMWIEKFSSGSWDDVPDSNIELKLSSLEEDVIVLATTLKLNQGEKLRLVASASDTKILLHTQSPAGEPIIPSIIFTMFKLGE